MHETGFEDFGWGSAISIITAEDRGTELINYFKQSKVSDVLEKAH